MRARNTLICTAPTAHMRCEHTSRRHGGRNVPPKCRRVETHSLIATTRTSHLVGANQCNKTPPHILLNKYAVDTGLRNTVKAHTHEPAVWLTRAIHQDRQVQKSNHSPPVHWPRNSFSPRSKTASNSDHNVLVLRLVG